MPDTARRSRTYNSMRNLAYSAVWQVVIYLFSFVNRTVFVHQLGQTYLGVNGLFSNILSILSIAELGIGSSFLFSLYKPLADGDTARIGALIHRFKVLYRIVAGVVAAAGLVLLPFLDVLIKDKGNIPHLAADYLIFLGLQVVSYLSQAERSLITADQKGYINTTNSNLFVLLQYLLQMGILYLWQSFTLYLLAQAICVIASNIFINRKAKRMYPYLRNRPAPKLEDAEKHALWVKIKAQLLHHIGYVVTNGTDSLVISAFVSVVAVGLYSNYLLIIGLIVKIISILFSAVMASAGNFVVQENSERTYRLFQKINFINFFLCAVAAAGLWALVNPLLTVWFGQDYLLDNAVVALIIVNFYIGNNGMRMSMRTFKNPSCLFTKDRFMSPVGAAINLVLSLILVQYLGLAGVFIGTLASELLTATFVEPYILFKYLFKRPLWRYVLRYLLYAGVTAALAAAMRWLAGLIFAGTWLSWFAAFAACGLSSVLVLTLLFCRTEEFRQVWDFFRGLLGRLRRKKARE